MADKIAHGLWDFRLVFSIYQTDFKAFAETATRSGSIEALGGNWASFEAAFSVAVEAPGNWPEEAVGAA